jgi:hypothetical protein
VAAVDAGVVVVIIVTMILRNWIVGRIAAARAARAGGSGGLFDGLLQTYVHPVMRTLGVMPG